MKEINKRDLKLVQALKTIAGYKEENGANFDKDILSLIDTLLQITEQKHFCPHCGKRLVFYVVKGEKGRFYPTVMIEE